MLLLQARLRTGDTKTLYARTGFVGFLKRTELTSADGGILLIFDVILGIFV